MGKRATATTFRYTTNCINASSRSITEMVDAATDVTYEEMARHCPDLEEWACGQGYGPELGLELYEDWHVSYHKSSFRGRPCYYVVHSSIEYIWLPA